jgi:hypothetical protein
MEPRHTAPSGARQNWPFAGEGSPFSRPAPVVAVPTQHAIRNTFSINHFYSTSFYFILLNSPSGPSGGSSPLCPTRENHAFNLRRINPVAFRRFVPFPQYSITPFRHPESSHSPKSMFSVRCSMFDVSPFTAGRASPRVVPSQGKSSQVKAGSRQAKITQPASHKRLKQIPAQNESRQVKPLFECGQAPFHQPSTINSQPFLARSFSLKPYFFTASDRPNLATGLVHPVSCAPTDNPTVL